jgi:hypothetical protein
MTDVEPFLAASKAEGPRRDLSLASSCQRRTGSVRSRNKDSKSALKGEGGSTRIEHRRRARVKMEGTNLFFRKESSVSDELGEGKRKRLRDVSAWESYKPGRDQVKQLKWRVPWKAC